jgi:hypothetical protein
VSPTTSVEESVVMRCTALVGASRTDRVSCAGAFAALTSLAAASAASGQLPEWTTIELQARSGGPAPFNLPPGAIFTSGTPAIGGQGQIAFRLITVGSSGVAGLWSGGGGTGQVVYAAPDQDPVITDPSINAFGEVVFDQYDLFSSDGLFRYDPKLEEAFVEIAPGGPLGIDLFGSPQINDAGAIAFRAAIGSGQAHVVVVAGVQSVLAGTPSVMPGSPYSFLFTPSLNNAGQVASKVQRASGGNEIRVFTGGGDSVLIAADSAANPRSPFQSFGNGVGLVDDGRVAFIASIAGTGGDRGVFLSDGIETTEIAREHDGTVTEIEFFNPSANAQGLVAFRGRDADGLRAIFVGDGVEIARVVGDRSAVPTDLGPAQIDRPDFSPVFGGNPRLNARGDLAFNASLTPLGNPTTSWGSGTFVAYADTDRPGDLDGNGVVDGADLTLMLAAWGACGECVKCPSDLDGDCAVGGADLAVLLANWGD